jgi:hypothetical protein
VRACIHMGECSFVYEYLYLYCVTSHKKKDAWALSFIKREKARRLQPKGTTSTLKRAMATRTKADAAAKALDTDETTR